MKILRCIVCLIVISVGRINAQQQLDSLVRLEKTYLVEDTIHAKLNTDIARGFYSADPVKGLV